MYLAFKIPSLLVLFSAILSRVVSDGLSISKFIISAPLLLSLLFIFLDVGISAKDFILFGDTFRVTYGDCFFSFAAVFVFLISYFCLYKKEESQDSWILTLLLVYIACFFSIVGSDSYKLIFSMFEILSLIGVCIVFANSLHLKSPCNYCIAYSAIIFISLFFCSCNLLLLPDFLERDVRILFFDFRLIVPYRWFLSIFSNCFLFCHLAFFPICLLYLRAFGGLSAFTRCVFPFLHFLSTFYFHYLFKFDFYIEIFYLSAISIFYSSLCMLLSSSTKELLLNSFLGSVCLAFILYWEHSMQGMILISLSAISHSVILISCTNQSKVREPIIMRKSIVKFINFFSRFLCFVFGSCFIAYLPLTWNFSRLHAVLRTPLVIDNPLVSFAILFYITSSFICFIYRLGGAIVSINFVENHVFDIKRFSGLITLSLITLLIICFSSSFEDPSEGFYLYRLSSSKEFMSFSYFFATIAFICPILDSVKIGSLSALSIAKIHSLFFAFIAYLYEAVLLLTNCLINLFLNFRYFLFLFLPKCVRTQLSTINAAWGVLFVSLIPVYCILCVLVKILYIPR